VVGKIPASFVCSDECSTVTCLPPSAGKRYNVETRRHKYFVDIRLFFVADAQAAELTQAGDRMVDYPAQRIHAGAVRRSSPRAHS
jgi:hypothetical protein